MKTEKLIGVEITEIDNLLGVVASSGVLPINKKVEIIEYLISLYIERTNTSNYELNKRLKRL